MDEEELQEKQRQRLSEIQRERLVLRYFNTCTPKDLQEITGCKEDVAKLVVNELRPFPDLDDLEEKLKQTKGAGVRFINICREMMEGYTAVDEIIESIENLGTELRDIFSIWERLGSHKSISNRASSPTDKDEDDQPGMNMTSIDADVEKYKSNPKYKDALQGYLTAQPKCVNSEFTLKDYQILGINWMLLLYRKGISGILADEMGLGKTAQVITFLGRLYELGDYGPHLIVVPSSTIENWAREFERFVPTLEIRLYHGSQQSRAELRDELRYENKQKEFQVILTTYQLASGHADDRNFLRKLRCRSMILDEGHMVKNCNSARYKSLMSIKAPFRLLLTGTPLQNNLQELVSLLTFIMPETFSNFEEELRSIFKIRKASAKEESTKSSTNAETSVQLLSKERISRAKRMMTPFVLRRKKEDVLKDLPKKHQLIEYCEMTPSQNTVYSEILLRNKANYEKTAEELEKDTKAKSSDFETMSNVVMHLRKAADHPLLFRNHYTDNLLRKMAKELKSDVKYWDSDEDLIYEDMTIMTDFELHNLCLEEKKIKRYMLQNEEWMDSGKVKKLQTLLPKFKKDGNKVLIFSQFTTMLNILEMCLNTMGTSYVRLDGSTNVMERQALIDQFNNSKDIDVFLLSTKAGGFGINLTSANIVILYDLDFNPQNDKQAEDRAHRVGQTKDVTIYKLIAKDSIEEHILSMANLKLRLDKNISAKEDEAMDEFDDENQKRSLVSIIKDTFKSANTRLHTL
ncbi:SNF2 family N-terminal domain-containing protein [Mycotypha africana]|uniref:SNF2 family N-terminal domain-containing protein n=1 Tax=Mycotypha africana TaxID=64632 RepID=UPI002301A215|nr:SNF2 family N-terminal domain-containing protein [Mycotypha africana]KAI8992022.1 SNF2 family N-terminal domain-containing protein [Mycotypha africana]